MRKIGAISKNKIFRSFTYKGQCKKKWVYVSWLELQRQVGFGRMALKCRSLLRVVKGHGGL